MLKNYFTIAWRNLRKNKGYSFINITGLAMGMAIALLIGLWITDEVSFDAYHHNHKNIAQVMCLQANKGDTYIGTTVAAIVPHTLHTGYDDLFSKVAQVSFADTHIITFGDKNLSRRGVWAQPEFPDLFTYQMVAGPITALKDPSTLMLSQSLATALFGSANPIGQTVRLDNELEFKVGGVFEDLPLNTTFHDREILLPWDNKANNYLTTSSDWDDHNSQAYVLMNDHVSTEQASARIRTLPTAHIKAYREEALVMPLDRLNLYGSQFRNGEPQGGRMRFIWLFGIIGGFVLLLACINFMNLSTARSEKRAKEVGIRKTIGSLRTQLIGQFLGESVLIAFLSLLLALLLVTISLPFFNQLTVKTMTLPWTNPLFALSLIAFTLLTGILAGSYPAFYLSGFRAVKVLKGSFKAGRGASLPRQILVVLQFSVSLILIIGTVIVYRQIQYTKDRPTGYDRDRLVTVPINTTDLQTHDKALFADLLRSGMVDKAAESSQSTTMFSNNNDLDWEGKDPSLNMVFFRNINVTPEFGQTVGWHVLQGRDFSRSFATDSNAIILNDTAAKIIGFKDPIGKTVTYGGKRRTVIGVVQNMVTNSPYALVEPAVFLGDGYLGVITLHLRAGLAPHAAIAAIEPLFKKYNPGSPFLYRFNDDEYSRKFESEERVGNLATVFAGLAIFISCLGLFGLAAFVAEQRTREIGVRKVLGAGVVSLWGLLSKEFLRLVALSLLISIPVAYIAMDRWLQIYVYHAPMSWWIFASAAIGILLITLLTVSYQSLRAATANPVKSLRAE